MKVLIVGMGNPILSDDAVGLFLVRSLRQTIDWADVTYGAVVGLNLLDAILGYDFVFMIDAMTTPDGKVGTWRKLHSNGRLGTLHLFSSHGINIFDLMELGKRCGFEMPRLAAVYGIEIGSEVAFGEELSPALKEKLPCITEDIIADMTVSLSRLSAADERFVSGLNVGIGI